MSWRQMRTPSNRQDASRTRGCRTGCSSGIGTEWFETRSTSCVGPTSSGSPCTWCAETRLLRHDSRSPRRWCSSPRALELPRIFDLGFVGGVALQGWGTAFEFCNGWSWYDVLVHFTLTCCMAPVLYISLDRLGVVPDLTARLPRRHLAGVVVVTFALGLATGALRRAGGAHRRGAARRLGDPRLGDDPPTGIGRHRLRQRTSLCLLLPRESRLQSRHSNRDRQRNATSSRPDRRRVGAGL